MNYPKKYIKNIAAFRLSTHRFEIEVGRHHRPKPMQAEQRTCRQCTSGKVENEYHVYNMFDCDKYTSLRSVFLNEILKSRLSRAWVALMH